MLTTPNAWYKMGLIPGALMIIWGTLLGIWWVGAATLLHVFLDAKFGGLSFA